ncbi:DUF2809 domain-containing protein [candidate division KSB1 bacterium]|nr:DUF2809 domain-containing protein [candidate division KSB1 bacterium]
MGQFALRKSLFTAISLILITPIGFATKFYSGPAQNWVNHSLGGVFYEIFWCLVIFLFFRNCRPFRIALAVLVLTCALEFLQLWHPPFLELLRSNFIGRTVLGNSFAWHDFPYYFIGSGIGWWWLARLRKSSNEAKAKGEQTEH